MHISITYTVATIGNHTFAIVKVSEAYESLRDSLKPVLVELNSLLCEKKIIINGTTVELELLFGSDLKVHVYMYICHVC